jgi:hypothetical protein
MENCAKKAEIIEKTVKVFALVDDLYAAVTRLYDKANYFLVPLEDDKAQMGKTMQTSSEYHTDMENICEKIELNINRIIDITNRLSK